MRLIFLILGIAFGFVLIQSGVSNYDVIRDMFLVRSFHLYGVLAIAVALTFLTFRVIKRFGIRSLVGGNDIDMSVGKPGLPHIAGGLIAGCGWAITGACPGPALALIGFGSLAGIFIAFGILLGVYFYGVWQS